MILIEQSLLNSVEVFFKASIDVDGQKQYYSLNSSSSNRYN